MAQSEKKASAFAAIDCSTTTTQSYLKCVGQLFRSNALDIGGIFCDGSSADDTVCSTRIDLCSVVVVVKKATLKVEKIRNYKTAR
jgi:hypothetical protein